MVDLISAGDEKKIDRGGLTAVSRREDVQKSPSSEEGRRHIPDFMTHGRETTISAVIPRNQRLLETATSHVSWSQGKYTSTLKAWGDRRKSLGSVREQGEESTPNS